MIGRRRLIDRLAAAPCCRQACLRDGLGAMAGHKGDTP
jgi:hypothetical protein